MKEYSCTFYVKGMHCAACEMLLESEAMETKGVVGADADLKSQKLKLKIKNGVSENEVQYALNSQLHEHGYELVDVKPIQKINWKNLGIGFFISAVLFGGFLLLQKLGIANVINTSEPTIPLIFIIGVIASLSTCMAVVGGIVLSISSTFSKGMKYKNLGLFHVSRIVSFFFLGGLIGLLGSAFILEASTIFIMNFAIFIIMLLIGVNLLNILNSTKALQVKMPKKLGQFISNFQIDNWFSAVLIGALTFFLPCGFTQAMQIYSLTTGSFISGAVTMFVFALGTFPVLGLISFASVKMSKTFQSDLFYKTAGFIIIFFAIFNFIAALTAIGAIEPLFY